MFRFVWKCWFTIILLGKNVMDYNDLKCIKAEIPLTNYVRVPNK